MDLVSVVVITYNSSETVIETLDSIYEQTYENIELVVSDDGSIDNTVEIVKEWLVEKKQRFENVQLLESKTNQGVVQNCNKAINSSNGKYIQYIAGDDILFPYSIERKYNFSKTNNLKYFVCKVEMFGDNQKLISDMERFCNRGYDIIEDGYERQKEEIAIANYIAGPAASFYEKDFWIESEGYDLRFPMLEDHPFLFKYIFNGNKLVLCNEVLGKYRISGNSLCHSSSPKFNRSYKDFFYEERLAALLKLGRRDVIESQVERILIDEKTDSVILGKMKKFESYYLLLSGWLRLTQKGRNLSEWFEDTDNRNIAIYGMGEIGERLIDELNNQNVNIVYGIDQSRTDQIRGIPVFTLQDKLPDADIIVVTVPGYFDEIKENIGHFLNINVVSIQQVVSELGKK